MRILLGTLILITGCLQAQVATPLPENKVQAPSNAAEPRSAQPSSVGTGSDDRPLSRSNISLVRGVLKQLDPIHDQLVVYAFGGSDVRIAFDERTQFLPGNERLRLTSLPAGSVVSVDTVIENGKLFARTVQKGTSNAAELNGQVVRYDAAKSQLTLRDRISPENVSLRLTSNTAVVNQGQPASVQVLSPGMLVRVWFSAAGDTANRVEILAKPGSAFTFQGRVVAVDLRSRILSLSNDTDQSLHELAFGSLDATSLGLLREGNEVNINAEFDGDRYNIRSVTPMAHNP